LQQKNAPEILLIKLRKNGFYHNGGLTLKALVAVKRLRSEIIFAFYFLLLKAFL
jgi:hypothetical protein